MSFRFAPLLLVPALGFFLHASGCSPAPPPAASGGSGPLPSGGGEGVGGAPASGGASSGGTLGSGGAAPTGGAGGGSSGGTPGSGGDVGSGGGTALTLVEPIERSATEFVLEFGDTKFVVDPTQGARVVTFSLAGTNLLVPTALSSGDPVVLNGGSTFWLSPQAAWGDWPPVAEIDSDAYAPTVTGSTINLVGTTATIGSTMAHIEKSFTADLTAGAVDLTYEIHNDGTSVAPYAPWEVSRLARGGLTFGPGAKAPDAGARWEFEPTAIESVYWWDDASSAASSLTNEKVSSDGEEGWVAHVDGNLLFVKTWTPVAAADIALDHGEVELYLGDGYIELEVQGPQADIAAAASSTFAVRWTVRALAPGTDVSPGSAALLAAVDAIVP
jgi:hypothetical protein